MATQGSDKVTEASIYQRYQAPDLLIINDVATVGTNEVDSRIVCEIIDKRYSSMKPTIIVSKNKENELSDCFGGTLLKAGELLRFGWC